MAFRLTGVGDFIRAVFAEPLILGPGYDGVGHANDRLDPKSVHFDYSKGEDEPGPIFWFNGEFYEELDTTPSGEDDFRLNNDDNGNLDLHNDEEDPTP